MKCINCGKETDKLVKHPDKEIAEIFEILASMDANLCESCYTAYKKMEEVVNNGININTI